MEETTTPPLFYLVDKRRDNGKIQICGEKNGSKWSGKVQQRLKPDAWSLVTLQMITGKLVPKTEIFHSVNTGDQKNILFKNLCFGEGPMNVVFGGGLSGSHGTSTAAYFGPFGIFPRADALDILPLRGLGQIAIPRHFNPLIVVQRYSNYRNHIQNWHYSETSRGTRSYSAFITHTDILINH